MTTDKKQTFSAASTKEYVAAYIRAGVRYRRPFVVVIHLGLIALSNYFAFWLRFDGAIPAREFNIFVDTMPWLLAFRGLTFIPCRMYEGLWRYTSMWDLRNILAGVFFSSTMLFVFARFWLSLAAYPRSVFVIDAILLIFMLVGVRLVRRVTRVKRPNRGKKVLIFGAGDAGETVVRDMKNNPAYDYDPLGFIDDDEAKIGQRIHGIPVLGTSDSLPEIMAEQRPQEVLVAISGLDSAKMRDLVTALEPSKAPIKILPSLKDILDEGIGLNQIRNLSVEDLLSRPAVGLDPEPVRGLVSGKRVLVTGAGGSIGSELCRQIAALQPQSLALLERHENSLFSLGMELGQVNGESQILSLVGDVTDEQRVDVIMRKYRPQIVFHAAAHKHVPLMEFHPCEAVKNNVTGTRIVAESADRYGVDVFVFISTDKAVNPTSVMGASKRGAELLLSARGNGKDQTRFVIVRFGNVLGSNGSVVPLFIDQIKAGGPVTVTHPEVRRYFMLVPEAVQLVLHAAVIGEGGATYVLDMGGQIKVLDMTRNLIRLSGFVPDVEIPISFTGLRPGEKLFEELAFAHETLEESPVGGILKVQSRAIRDRDGLMSAIAKLEEAAAADRSREVLRHFRLLVPNFEPSQAARSDEQPEEPFGESSYGAAVSL